MPTLAFLTPLSQKYALLHRSLLPPTSDPPPSDTSLASPSDSHLSRVLRAYYSEKQKESSLTGASAPWPAWLEGGPPTPPPPANYPLQQQQGPVGSLRQNALSRPLSSSSNNSSGGGLSSIFSEPPSAAGGGGLHELSSLRRPVGARVGSTQSGPGALERTAAAAPRPLPSQREGSYQQWGGEEGGGRERLRRRFGGAGGRGSVEGGGRGG